MLIGSILTLLSQACFFFLQVGSGQSFPPPLSREREQALFEALHESMGGDREARDLLIVHNLRLVSHIVRKYYATSDTPDDLVSIGSVGLMKAVDSFDPSNGARFATYASRCIQNAILSQRTFSEGMLQVMLLLMKSGVSFATWATDGILWYAIHPKL